MEAILEECASIPAGVLDTVDVEELRGFLVASAVVDEHQAHVVLDQETPHAERNAVACVRRDAAFPEWLRHHAEHRAPVERLTARLNRVHGPGSQRPCLDERLWNGHAVVSRSTGRGIALRRRLRDRTIMR